MDTGLRCASRSCELLPNAIGPGLRANRQRWKNPGIGGAPPGIKCGFVRAINSRAFYETRDESLDFAFRRRGAHESECSTSGHSIPIVTGALDPPAVATITGTLAPEFENV